MPDIVQFVDSISATPTVRLDLNDDAIWNLRYERTDMSPPKLKQAWADNTMTDGQLLVAAAFDNRTLRLDLDLITSTVDGAATQMQLLWRELNRSTNFIRWQPQGASAPVFFRTWRSVDNRVAELPGAGALREIDVAIEAEPFALGLRETLSTVRIANDPALANSPDNANPFFELDASNWSAANGASVARSTAQAWEGVASLLVTPGASAVPQAQCEELPAVAGQSYWLSGRIRSTSTATRTLNIAWLDASHTFISASAISQSATASTWVGYGPTKFVAPVGAAFRRITTTDPGTPGAGNPWYLDAAMTWADGATTGCCWDITGVKGDVEAPLRLTIPQGSLTGGSDPRRSVIAVRRRGTPSAMPLVLQAETMTAGVDTALGAAGDPNMSGGGANFLRTTFATTATLVARATITGWPAAASGDTRGTYRLFVRVRKSVGGDVITMQASLATPTVPATTDTVALPSGFATVPIWVDLGLLPIPAGADPVTDGQTGVELPVGPQTLSLLASRTSGSGTLDWDCLLLVPADDRLCIVDWPLDTALSSIVLDSVRTMVYAVGAGGEVRSTGRVPIVGGPPMVSPGVTNRIVWLQDTGTRASSAVATIQNATTITPSYHPRYLYVRPATT